MIHPRLRQLLASAVLLLCALTSACGSTSPAGPTPEASFDGQWMGMTSQGRQIAFTVAAERVTAISVGYSVGNCSGTRSFPNLTLPIGTPPNPAAPWPGPGFAYGSGSPEDANYVQVSGFFTSATTANGSFVFANFPGCGMGLGIWSASKK